MNKYKKKIKKIKLKKKIEKYRNIKYKTRVKYY